MNAWEIAELGLVAETAEESARLFELALSEVNGSSYGSDSDRVELRAVIAAAQAFDNVDLLADAVELVEKARALGRVGWPNYHLAEAAWKHRRHQLLESSIESVPAGYFEGQDKRWRSVRLRELEAMSLVEQSEYPLARERIAGLADEYEENWEEHFLASPAELIRVMLAYPAVGREPMRRLVDSIDIDLALSSDLAAEVRGHLATQEDHR